MAKYEVVFRHTEEVEADNEADACRIMADLVKSNAEAADCDAWCIDEIEIEPVEG